MKEEITEFIEKAERSLKVAESLFESEDFDFAVSRAYYSMFYMAQACLLTKNLSFSKHSGVISAFNLQFVKTDTFDKKYFKSLRFAFNQRQIGDYESSKNISKDTAKRTIDGAITFIKVTKIYLESFIERGDE